MEFCAQPARQLLEWYFPAHDDPAPLPPPLVEVERFAPDDPGVYLVLVLKEKAVNEHAYSLARLGRLGLTPSESRVLYWPAQGKSN